MLWMTSILQLHESLLYNTKEKNLDFYNFCFSNVGNRMGKHKLFFFFFNVNSPKIMCKKCLHG